MSDWLDELMGDHGRIERALVMIEKQVNNKEGFDSATVAALLEFLLEYGERWHNRKEEEALFPRLGERGVPTNGGPIAVMLMEHDSEKKYLQKLIPYTMSIKDGKSEAIEDYRNDVRDYIALTKDHIWKENDILYPMGRRVLTTDDTTWLIEQFRNLDSELPYRGEGFTLRWENLLTAVEHASGGRVDLLATLTTDTIRSMMDSLPVELTFVDVDDTVRYFNKVYEKKVFPRTLSVVGRKVQQCHPPKSVHLVNQILSEMKAGTRDTAAFWIPFGEQHEMLLHISYHAVRDTEGNYIGCVEMTHDIAPYRSLDGESRTLSSLI